ncbi:MAG: hypothetical protein IJG68_00180 [Bacilli bacterium]|nr:hypothetical protein [Bacilli bacterium]
MIKCPNCTGELDFNVKDKEIKCSYCGSTFKPSELKAKVKMSGEKKTVEEKNGQFFEGKSYTCSQCGAVLMTFDETAITFCSYCGSQAMIESKMMKQNNPDFIIPFQVDKEKCIENYKKKISRSLFVPAYMKKDTVVEKFRGIFIPYCIYTLEYHGNTSNNGSKFTHSSGNYDYYDDYAIKVYVDAKYEGVSYDLISKYYDKFSYAIPYNTKEKLDFNPNYLVGFYADTRDVPEAAYDSEAREVSRGDANKKLRKVREYSKYGCHSPVVGLDVTERKIGMFPVYFLAIRDKANKNVSYAVVNGQTGEVAADIPIDFKKYIIFSLILSIAVFLGIDYMFVLTPNGVCILTILFAIISLIFNIIQINKISDRATHASDIGYTVANKINKRKKEKINSGPYIWKPIISMIIPLFVLFAGIIDDEILYGAALIGLAFVVLSFKDLVKEHNILVSNKLPQLEKRGGDEK